MFLSENMPFKKLSMQFFELIDDITFLFVLERPKELRNILKIL